MGQEGVYVCGGGSTSWGDGGGGMYVVVGGDGVVVPSYSSSTASLRCFSLSNNRNGINELQDRATTSSVPSQAPSHVYTHHIGLAPQRVESGLQKIQQALAGEDKLKKPYAVNLIHSPFDDKLEKQNVDLFLKYKVPVVEASAFMKVTKHLVRYRLKGLSVVESKIKCSNRVIGKCSRTELAAMYLAPSPAKLIHELLAEGSITPEQANLAKFVPLADDIAVEADSGGHTDNRPFTVLFPSIKRVRDALLKDKKIDTGVKGSLSEAGLLAWQSRTRVGIGGGIGCPEAVRAAFAMGADFVLTGSINQIARESGTCDVVRKMLSKATYSDVTMAAAADMFTEGVKLQVLKRGTMFAGRANQLFQVYEKYDCLEDIPDQLRKKIETVYFRKSTAEVWEETKNFYINMLNDPDRITKAEKTDPKLKMALVFKWYLGLSSFWANTGVKGRELDYQVWAGPAIGAFNGWVRNDPLLDVNRGGNRLSVPLRCGHKRFPTSFRTVSDLCRMPDLRIEFLSQSLSSSPMLSPNLIVSHVRFLDSQHVGRCTEPEVFCGTSLDSVIPDHAQVES